MTIRSILITAIIILSGAIIAAYAPQTGSPADDQDREKLIIAATVRLIEAKHFNPADLNDEFSKMVFETYLDRLDGAKRFLTAADYDRLDDYEYKIDDAVRDPDLEFFELSYGMVQEAYEEVKQLYPQLLSKPFDFTMSEEVQLDGDNLDYASTDAELHERWRQFLKYQTLTRLSNKLDEQENSDDPDVTERSFDELEEEAREEVVEMMDEWIQRFEESRRSDYFEMYLNSITNTIDPHTDYFNPKRKDDFDITMSGRLEGIGARLQRSGSYTKVVSIVPGGPAWKQGDLEVDDLIYAVAQEDEESVSTNGMHIDDVVSMIRGDKGTYVTLTVKKIEGDMQDIRIRRDEVLLDEGLVKSAIMKFPGRVDKVGYIDLPRFYADFENPDGRSCSEDVARELDKLKKKNVDGIILDLRNNSGGSLNDVVEMTGLFIESGPIVQVKSRDDKPYVFRDKDPEVKYDGPLIVMVNKYSASASEILAAALQDYGRAIIVGSTSTFGKGTVQRFYDLDRMKGFDEYKPLGEVKITVQKFYRVNGGSTQLLGVQPDIVLPDRFNYVDVGEKQLDHPLAWTEIGSLDYSQRIANLSGLREMVNMSNLRVQANPIFKKIDENAMRIKDVRETSTYSLNLEEFQADKKARKEQADKYKDIFEPIAGLVIENLPEDMDFIQLDSSRIARNDSWMENLEKDVYIDETISIMHDMIEAGVAVADPKKP